MLLKRPPAFRRHLNGAREGRTLKPSERASLRQKLRPKWAGEMMLALGPVEALAGEAMTARRDPGNIQSQAAEPIGSCRCDGEGFSLSIRDVATAVAWGLAHHGEIAAKSISPS